MIKKYFVLFFLLFFSLVHAKTQFASQTIKTYSGADDAKSVGKVLPTTPFEVVKVQGDKALVKITGWNQGKIKRVVYYSKGERIISAVFSKKAKYEIKVLETLNKVAGSKKPWTKVEVTTWVDNKGFIDDIKPLFAEAKSLLDTNCGLCHAAHPTHEYSANQWPSVIKAMFPRTPMSKEQKHLITQYAQKHAKK